jgi:hypothetical protein
MAKSAGISLEEITAAIQLLSNAGVQGEMAGTTLRGILLSQTSPTAERVKTMATLLGANADEWTALAGRVPEDLPAIIQKQPTAMPELLREASGLTADQLRFLCEQARKLNERGTPGGGRMGERQRAVRVQQLDVDSRRISVGLVSCPRKSLTASPGSTRLQGSPSGNRTRRSSSSTSRTLLMAMNPYRVVVVVR